VRQSASGADAADRPDLGGQWAAAVVAVAIVFAVVVSIVRARAGSVDLWYDDSWVGFAGRMPLSEAMRIGVTAPGFTVVVRWWMGLGGTLAWWQSFALVGFAVSPAVVFVAARAAGAARWAATVAAALTAVNPMLLAESSRVKQYTWEFALSAVMLALAAAVRRAGPTVRWTAVSAVVVVGATFFSASMLIPGALLFLVLAVGLWIAVHRPSDPLPTNDALKRVVILAGGGSIILATAIALARRSPPALKASYLSLDGFFGASPSLHDTPRQAWALVRGFMDGFVFGGSTLLLVVPLAALAWVAWRRWRTEWWLLAAPVLAVILSAAQRYPLAIKGYSRVDAWLMPWIVVLLALALTDLASVAEISAFAARVPTVVRTATFAAVALVLAVVAWQHTPGYPTTRSRQALRTLTEVGKNGPAYVVYQDDPIDVVAPSPIHIVNDDRSLQGYSVAGLGGGLHVLQLSPADAAARELQAACGHTAVIAGAAAAAVATVLPSVRCRVLRQQVQTQGTPRVDDDTIVVTFGPVTAG
jgi:hypothetical protein